MEVEIRPEQFALAPKRVTGMRARRMRTGIVLGWNAAKGSRPIAVYRVARNGKLFAQVRRATSLAVPKAKGTWAVVAVGEGGFAGAASAPLRVA